MPYQYLEDIATADVAFEARGDTVEDMFVAAADATMNVMVEDLNTIADRQRRIIHVEADAVDMLLFQLLQELIYYKDAERLLLRVPEVHIQRQNDGFSLSAEAYGEELDPDQHELLVDVKAVTLHRFQVQQTESGWKAMVILDI
ncbi:MAG: archease [Anaerolineae bacterium]